jgi:hypothetical protein
MSWFFDNVWSVFLGDPHNGYDAEETVYSAQEAAEWLRANGIRRYPNTNLLSGSLDPIRRFAVPSTGPSATPSSHSAGSGSA